MADSEKRLRLIPSITGTNGEPKCTSPAEADGLWHKVARRFVASSAARNEALDLLQCIRDARNQCYLLMYELADALSAETEAEVDARLEELWDVLAPNGRYVAACAALIGANVLRCTIEKDLPASEDDSEP